MEVRFINRKDVDLVKRMNMYCFGVPEERVNWLAENVFSPENCIGAYEEGKLAASLYIFPFEIFFGKRVVKMGGIASVATLPEHRRRGYASRMLIESLRIMRERGQIFSMLAPFSYEFYRRYGWELGFHKKKYTLHMKDMKKFGDPGWSFRPLGPDDADSMNSVYESFIKHYYGGVRRDQDMWKRKFEEIKKFEKNFHCYGTEDQEHNLRGYIFFSIREEKLYVEELVYDSLRAKKALFYFIYLHDAQACQIIWQAPADDNTFLLLDNPDEHKLEIQSGMMVRVVNAKSVLENYPFDPTLKESFTMKIDDIYAPWNNAVFKVEVEDGRAKVEVLGSDALADLRCSIQAFSQVAIGYIGLKEAAQLEKVKVPGKEKLDKMKRLFPAKVTYINDHF